MTEISRIISDKCTSSCPKKSKVIFTEPLSVRAGESCGVFVFFTKWHTVLYLLWTQLQLQPNTRVESTWVCLMRLTWRSRTNIDVVTGILVELNTRVPNSEEENPPALNIQFGALLQSKTVCMTHFDVKPSSERQWVLFLKDTSHNQHLSRHTCVFTVGRGEDQQRQRVYWHTETTRKWCICEHTDGLELDDETEGLLPLWEDLRRVT